MPVLRQFEAPFHPKSSNGTKRTLRRAVTMSAFDPKRTSPWWVALAPNLDRRASLVRLSS